jgi:hypothetical protein
MRRARVGALIALLALFALLAAFVFGRDDDDAGAATRDLAR